jgi:Kef-type K+ transport system membrane component KefB
MPTPPIEIVAGSILAYFGILGNDEFFDMIAEMGFLYLMFLAGMEVNLKEITGSEKGTLRQAMLFVGSLWILSVASGTLLGYSPIVIVSLPLISIGLLASLSRIYDKKTPWLQLSVTVGVIGEITSIVALTVLDAASTVGFGLKLWIKLGYLSLFIAGIYILYKLLKLLFWWFPEIKSELMPKLDTSDQDIRLSMSLFFILITLMLVLHLELALGSFIAGVAISAFFHHKKSLEEKMSSLGFGFLVPLFFIHVGVSFDLESLAIPGIFTGALLITALSISIRIISAFHLRKIADYQSALTTAFALSMPLTLLIAVATIGYTSGNIDIMIYYQMILASLFEVIVSMVAIKTIEGISHKKTVERYRKQKEESPAGGSSHSPVS